MIHSKHNKLLFISSFNCCCWLQSSSKWITDIFDRSYKDNLNIILVCLSCHMKIISSNIFSAYISTLCIFVNVYFLHMKYENHFHRIIYISYIQPQYNGTFNLGEYLILFFPYLIRGRDMNNNLRMSGSMCLMLKKSSDRRQQEALENAFKVIGIEYGQLIEYH